MSFLAFPKWDVIPYRDDKDKKEKPEPAEFDDDIDRMHHRLTVTIIAMMMFAIGAQQYFGSPVACFAAAENTKIKGWTDYIQSYCFLHPSNRFQHGYFEYPLSNLSRKYFNNPGGAVTNYYHWIPLFMAFQLFCFWIPKAFWDITYNSMSLGIHTIVQDSKNMSKELSLDKREKQMTSIANQIFSSLQYSSKSRFVCWHMRSGTTFYVVYKLLEIANVTIQLLLMAKFLGFHVLWGTDVVTDLFGSSYTWDHIHYFPREGRCVYTKVELGNVHSNVVQCAFPMNYWNEKIFLAQWIWFIALLALTILNVIAFVFSRVFRTSHQTIVAAIVESDGDANIFGKVDRFVDLFLGSDGILLAEMIAMNTGWKTCGEIMGQVWKKSCKEGVDILHTPRRGNKLLNRLGIRVSHCKDLLPEGQDANGKKNLDI